MIARKMAAAAKELFLASLDLPTAERPAFIDHAAADEPVREAARSLLEAYVEADALLTARTAPPPADGFPSVETKDGFSEELGEKVGPYTLVERIGEGGFGIVYRAHQETPVKRDVALKLLKPGMDSRAIAQRFELERQSLAMMTHPGIARIYGAGTTPGGRPYFAMELVEGAPITAYCDRARLTIRERLDLFHKVCLAVQHAHQRGVIHRDIKPGNVLIVEFDGRPEPKVIDFGIAKAITGRGQDSAVTHPAQVLGTPMYMAPEQASGGEIDTRTDVYALGVLLYELLAGVPPFDPQRLETAPLPELARIIADENPPRPSSRVTSLGAAAEPIAAVRRTDTNRLWRELRGELDHLIRCATEKDPALRYPGVPSLAADVRRYLQHEPLEAGPASVRYRAAKFLRRHWVESVSVALVAAAVVALAAGAVVFAVRQHENAERLESQRARSDAAAVFAQSIFSGVDPALAKGKDTELLRGILAGAQQRVGSELADVPEAASDMLITIGASFESIGALDQAEATFREAADHATRHFGADSDRALGAEARVATVLTHGARYPEALQILEPLLERSRRIRGSDHAETLSVQLNLATLYGRMGRTNDAADQLAQIHAARAEHFGIEHESTLTAANNLAMLLEDLDRFDEAIAMFRQVLDAQQRALGADHPRTLTTAHNLAGVYMEAGRNAEASDLYAATLTDKRRILGADHQSTINTACTLAILWTRMGRTEDAESLLRETLVAAETGLPEQDPRWVMLYNSLAGLYLRTERFEPAEPLAAKAAAAMISLAGPDHPDSLRLRSNHAYVLLKLARHEECLVEAHEILDRAVSVRGPADPLTVDLCRMIASALRALGRIDEARGFLVERKAAAAAQGGADNPEIGRLDQAIASLDTAGDG